MRINKTAMVPTFSITVGSTSACNGSCPFCVARMTGMALLTGKEVEPDWYSFDIACRWAQVLRVANVILTSKGETTLHRDKITRYLEQLAKYAFPFLEMQTNGLLFDQRWDIFEPYLQEWHQKGLSLISISMVSPDPEANRQIYLPQAESYIDLPRLVGRLHDIGYTVRINCTMVKGIVDSVAEVKREIATVREWRADQLTIRPVTLAHTSEHDPAVFAWTKAHQLTRSQKLAIRDYLLRQSRCTLVYGADALLCDIGGQNVSLSNCLTVSKSTEEPRSIIYFEDGTLLPYWEFPAFARLAGRNYGKTH